MMRSTPYPQPAFRQASEKTSDAIVWVRRGIFLYFWLLVFEGALRKWILPQLSAPLLIVRDPIVIFIYWQAYRSRKLKSPDFVPIAAIGICTAFLAAAQIAIGNSDFQTALFGLRSYFLHLPLIFVMKQVMSAQDIKKIGLWILLITLPMAFLMMAQFREPESSWFNRAAGGGAGQLSFTGEHVRASGTFSYVTGTSDFFPFVTAFLLLAFTEAGYPKVLIATAALGNLLAIPVAGSRTLIVITGFVCLCAVLVNIRNVRAFARLSAAAAVLAFAGALAFQSSMVGESFDALQTRWTDANTADGGERGVQGALSVRVLKTITEPFEDSTQFSWLGEGIGLGSTGLAALNGHGDFFVLAEDEWPRVFEEFGPVFGFIFMAFRCWLCGLMVVHGFRALRRGSSMALVFASAAIPLLVTGVMEQSTTLGFIAFGAGLSLAAANIQRPAKFVPSEF